MTFEQRTSHLRQVLGELVIRLRSYKEIGSKEMISLAAVKHGEERRKAGYSAAMLIEESRMLQVSLFQTLQNNLASLDFSVLLIGVMTIADEIDSQLSQAMDAYMEESVKDALPALTIQRSGLPGDSTILVLEAGLLSQLEDSNLNQLANGQIVQTPGLHPLDEIRRDLEDAHLDQLVERGLVAQGAHLFHFLRVDPLHTQGNQLARIRSRVTEGIQTMQDIVGVCAWKKIRSSDEIFPNRDCSHSRGLQGLDPVNPDA